MKKVIYTVLLLALIGSSLMQNPESTDIQKNLDLCSKAMNSIKLETLKENASKILEMNPQQLLDFLESYTVEQVDQIEACANIDPDWFQPDFYYTNFKNRDCMYVYHQAVIDIYNLSQNGPLGTSSQKDILVKMLLSKHFKRYCVDSENEVKDK